jgi:phospholipid-binding lipoprotein MlaA
VDFPLPSAEIGIALPTVARHCLAAAALIALAACAAPPPRPIAETDPHEAQNRAMHEFNKAFDTALVRPASEIFGDGDNVVSDALRNAAGNLRTPRSVVNLVLQARLEAAVQQTLRFAVNSTVGLGGLFDPATAIGLASRQSDFGETLHVWGVAEGDYIELPIASASTGRDALGTVVDFVIDPVGWVLPDPWNWVGRGVNVASRVSERARFRDEIDSILYESADSYAQMRLLYLQSRRFELGQEAADDEIFDPYAE